MTLIHWFVTTPSYSVHEVVLDDGTGPTYDVSDWEEVDAPTRREAVSLAVKKWLAERTYYGNNYCQSRRGDGLSPYKGVRAQSEDEAREETREGGPPDWQPEVCDITDTHSGATHWVWIESHPDPDLRWGWFGTCDEHDPERAKSVGVSVPLPEKGA